MNNFKLTPVSHTHNVYAENIEYLYNTNEAAAVEKAKVMLGGDSTYNHVDISVFNHVTSVQRKDM